jgi:hypothetical protein
LLHSIQPQTPYPPRAPRQIKSYCSTSTQPKTISSIPLFPISH